jgi:tRNA splicing ligase
MTLSKKPVAKKRGRPLGSKNKTSAAKVRAWEKNNILEENIAVWDELKKVSAQVADLQHKEIGYRAVISYLQARLDGNAEL